MEKILYTLSIVLLICACGTSVEQEEDTVNTVVPTVAQTTETEDTSAITYLATSVGKIPVYKNYDQIAHLFEQANDTTYVVNFWATWCKPCVEELPFFEQMTEKHQNEKVQVLLVSLDFKKQLESKLKPFLEEKTLQSEVVAFIDGKYNNWIDNISPDWSGAIPATLIYNKTKRTFFEGNFPTYLELEERLQMVR